MKKDFTVACNLKMNSVDEEKYFKGLKPTEIPTIFCPNFLQLEIFRNNLKDGQHLGAQNVSELEIGATTGEISGEMLKRAGVKYCIIGHSERRKLFGENNQTVFNKLKLLQKHQIIPILCVGEEKKTDTEKALMLVGSQLKECMTDSRDVIVAYEPVWSIGTGDLPTCEHIERICRSIKQSVGVKTCLYGGSVNEKNCGELVKLNSVDGFLIGGASLSAEKLNLIYSIIERELK